MEESLIKSDDRENDLKEGVKQKIIESLKYNDDAFQNANLFSKLFFHWAFRILKVIRTCLHNIII